MAHKKELKSSFFQVPSQVTGHQIDTGTSELHLALQYTAASWQLSSGFLYFFFGFFIAVEVPLACCRVANKLWANAGPAPIVEASPKLLRR